MTTSVVTAGDPQSARRYVVTGADGFLGYHARARLAVDPAAHVVPISRTTWHTLPAAVAQADVVLHLAGVNRPSSPEQAEAELAEGNVALAWDLVEALDAALAAGGADGPPPPVVVYAGSTYADPEHPGTDSPYGRGKRDAGAVLREWGDRVGARVVEVRFPGLFGEHGRPAYNSFVATFADRIARGEQPVVTGDREVPLLPVGEAVGCLFEASAAHGGVGGRIDHPPGRLIGISQVAGRLQDMYDTYSGTGDLPDLSDPFDVALFNTLRAAMWPQAYPLRPTPRSDARGTLVETVRVHGGGGQGFVSSTEPGFRRGDHVHFAKIERFQVIGGTGLIRLRRMLTDETVEFTVTGAEPAVVDMPTLWTHSIENVGTAPLLTFFWTNELFDPQRPDTYPLPVLDGSDRPEPPASEQPSGSAPQETR